jgi:predicted O-methyltransferase YrrM
MSFSLLKSVSSSLRVPFNRRWALRRLQEYHSNSSSLPETVDWAMNFSGTGRFKIHTLQIRHEILQLADTVLRSKPRIILEIGTSRAGTLLIWPSIESSRVISCDSRDVGPVREFYEALPPPHSTCRVELLVGDSHAAEFRKRVADELGGEQLGGELVDFLFIDGDHTVERVARDYEDYKPFVRPGGLIAFHDIVERQVLETNQVYRFWKTIRTRLDTKDFIADLNQAVYGIRLVRVSMDNSAQ